VVLKIELLFLNYLNYYLKNFHRKFVSMKIRNFV